MDGFGRAFYLFT